MPLPGKHVGRRDRAGRQQPAHWMPGGLLLTAITKFLRAKRYQFSKIC